MRMHEGPRKCREKHGHLCMVRKQTRHSTSCLALLSSVRQLGWFLRRRGGLVGLVGGLLVLPWI